MLNPSTLEQVSEHREYRPEDFLDREKELKQVALRVVAGRSGNSINSPLLNFWGVAGIGKSWLLRHIQNEYHFKPDVLTKGQRPTFTLLFDFRRKETKIPVIAQIAREMASQLLSQVGSALPDDARSHLEQVVKLAASRSHGDKAIGFFTDTINLLSQTFVPILLFDSMESEPEEVRDDFEVSIVEPVLWHDHVIVIVAGRRQVPRWKRFEVRHRAADAADTGILPFDRGHVQTQLTKWDFTALAGDVYTLSSGHPQTTDILGRYLRQAAEKSRIDSHFLIRNRRELGDLLTLVENHVLEGVGAETRTALEIIAALRYFRIESLRQFMVEFRGKEYESRPDSYYLRDVIGALEATNLVWWSRQHRAYIISEVVRKLINRRLILTQHDRYDGLHSKALQMYLGWIGEFPRSASEFIIEAFFHLAMLYQDTDGVKLGKMIDERLKDVMALSSEEANILYEQLQLDKELEELLAPDRYKHLLSDCRSIRDQKSQESAPAG